MVKGEQSAAALGNVRMHVQMISPQGGGNFQGGSRDRSAGERVGNNAALAQSHICIRRDI